METHHDALGYLPLTVVLLAAAVLSVPIARQLRLSAIIAYLAAGALIGPFGLGLFRTPGSVLAVAELGVVMLLFVIGLELELSRLFKMRRDIFGLGAGQLVLTASAVALLAWMFGSFGWGGAIVAGLALAMSATSIALRTLEERGDMQLEYGQRAFAILLFQDMAVVPLLALLPLLAPYGGAQPAGMAQTLYAFGLGAAAIAAVVVAGRYLLNPVFRLLAQTGAREIMTAAALLIVLGTAFLMHEVGMSMALGAFLAGVLLAESSYRHELEADIEPFRGLLLALFFMGVGMGIDLPLVLANLWLILGAAVLVTVIKLGIVWGLFRFSCARQEDALRAGSILTAAGEFAFVLLPLGGTLGLMSTAQVSLLAAIAAITMLLSSPTAALTEVALRRLAQSEAREADSFDGVRGSVLLVGFGRFGQIVAQSLLAEGIDVTTIDNDPEMIQVASRFGFKVYYGDGTRLDVLRAAGAGQSRLVAVCVERRETADRIVELLRSEFEGTKLFVRSYDRAHSLTLLARGVEFELRETYESALAFGQQALIGLGIDPERAAATAADVRERDRARFALQQAEGIYAGVDHLHKSPVPQPLREPRRRGESLNPEAEELIQRNELVRPQQ
jgi:glutathione-regulated potassium-efflux system protein KefB